MPERDFTEQEMELAKVLDELGMRYEYQFEVYPYTLDFYIPMHHLVIEADGMYGHYKKADRKRDLYLKNCGFSDIIRIKGYGFQDILVELLNKLSTLE